MCNWISFELRCSIKNNSSFGPRLKNRNGSPVVSYLFCASPCISQSLFHPTSSLWQPPAGSRGKRILSGLKPHPSLPRVLRAAGGWLCSNCSPTAEELGQHLPCSVGSASVLLPPSLRAMPMSAHCPGHCKRCSSSPLFLLWFSFRRKTLTKLTHTRQ